MVVACFPGNVNRTGGIRASWFREHVFLTIVTVFTYPTQITFTSSKIVAGTVSVTTVCCCAQGVTINTVLITETPVDSAVPIFVTHTRSAGLAVPMSSTCGRILAVAGVPSPTVVTGALACNVAGAPATADTFARTDVLTVLPSGSVRAGTVCTGANVGHHASSYATALVKTRILTGVASVPILAVAIDHQSSRLTLTMPTA